MPAELVGALYHQRWRIELFFRWIKCILGCRHWLAESPRGVAIEIYLALIAALLLQLYSGRRPNRRMLQSYPALPGRGGQQPRSSSWLATPIAPSPEKKNPKRLNCLGRRLCCSKSPRIGAPRCCRPIFSTKHVRFLSQLSMASEIPKRSNSNLLAEHYWRPACGVRRLAEQGFPARRRN